MSLSILQKAKDADFGLNVQGDRLVNITILHQFAGTFNKTMTLSLLTRHFLYWHDILEVIINSMLTGTVKS